MLPPDAHRRPKIRAFAHLRGRPVPRDRDGVRCGNQTGSRRHVPDRGPRGAHSAASHGLHACERTGVGRGTARHIRGALGHQRPVDRAGGRNARIDPSRAHLAAPRRCRLVQRSRVRTHVGRLARAPGPGPRARALASAEVRRSRVAHCAATVAAFATYPLRSRRPRSRLARHGASSDSLRQHIAGDPSWLDPRHW